MRGLNNRQSTVQPRSLKSYGEPNRIRMVKHASLRELRMPGKRRHFDRFEKLTAGKAQYRHVWRKGGKRVPISRRGPMK